MTAIRYHKDHRHRVTLTLDLPDQATNIMNGYFRESLSEVALRLKGESELNAVILASAKPTFFAGGDLQELRRVDESQKKQFFDAIEAMKASMRTIETLGVPVVALLSGSALGGGWEVALMAHHRIAIDDDRIKCGLPEVNWGLLPGAGGVTKMVRLLGLEAALPYLVEGRLFSPKQGYAIGLIHELVESQDSLLDAAHAWLDQCLIRPFGQPFDQKGYKIPGGLPSSPQLAAKIMVAPAALAAKTKGCFPAPEAILACAVEGTYVDVDHALKIESRMLVFLACHQVAKNLIGTLFFQMNRLKKGLSRPALTNVAAIERLAIIGAGMMGSGIACACARSKLSVILIDVDLVKAQKGKDKCAQILAVAVKKDQISADQCDQILARIQPSSDLQVLSSCDLIIEAVFEDRQLKAQISHQIEPFVSDAAVVASNTSTLPISGLAQSCSDPSRFVGLHFFSPVEKMRLVEIIKGDQTSDLTLARVFDLVLQLGKLPIVVNDSRGFFTSRVFATFIDEGMALLESGSGAALIEQSALLAGMPMGPLAVADEVNLGLIDDISKQAEMDANQDGDRYHAPIGHQVLSLMLEQGRRGRAQGGGFYDYPSVDQQGAKKRLWPELAELFPAKVEIPQQDIQDRLIFVQVLEAIRCLDEGVINSIGDANIGSIFGIGFPSWTGGVLQFANQYGLEAFVHRCQQLSAVYGPRFCPPPSLVQRSAEGRSFQDGEP